jgi:hypothetical protein
MTASPSPYTNLLLPTTPVAYWAANDAAGATAKDTSGNGHDATLLGDAALGAAGLIPDESDTALALSGAGALALPSLALAGPFSLSCIVKPTGDAGTSVGYGALFGFGGPGILTHRLLWADASQGGRILAQMGGGSLYSPTASVPAGSAAHVVYTSDGATERIYVNGTLAASQANTHAVWNAAAYVGAYGALGGAYQLEGVVEKVAVHNVALDAATIASLAAVALDPPAQAVQVMEWNGSAYVPAPSSVTIYNGPTQPANAKVGDIWNQTRS